MGSPLLEKFNLRLRHSPGRHLWSTLLGCAVAALAAVVTITFGATLASASPTSVGLGKATPFAVLGASAVTNTGASVIIGDLGVYAGTSVSGTPNVEDGSIYRATAVAQTAQSALATAYSDAAGRTPTTAANFTSTGLGGKSLVAGVYNATSTLQLTGTLTLNGGGDPDSVFIFQAGESLITASDSTVRLIGGAQACNVFWKVGSSATLGTTSTFVGTVMALTSVTVTTKVTVTGRVLARTGAVTMIDDTITRPATCITATATTPTITKITPSSGPTSGGTTVVITGTGFTGATAVKFGTTPATSYVVTSTTHITAISPTGTGIVSVSVTTPGGTKLTTAAFTYLAASTTTSPVGTVPTTVPAAGSTASGTGVLASGTVVPVGSPETGLGGASRSGPDPILVAAGSFALFGAGVSVFLAMRRRRSDAVAIEGGPSRSSEDE